jgi:hypothetical protein
VSVIGRPIAEQGRLGQTSSRQSTQDVAQRPGVRASGSVESTRRMETGGVPLQSSLLQYALGSFTCSFKVAVRWARAASWVFPSALADADAVVVGVLAEGGASSCDFES